MRSFRLAVVLALVVSACGLVQGAQAVAYKQVTGVVADAAGSTIDSAMVTYYPKAGGIGGRSGTFTNAQGRYVLNISLSDLPAVIYVSKDSIVRHEQEVSALDDGDIDFIVRYQFFPEIPEPFATALPHAFTMRAQAYVSPSKLCVEAIDRRTGQTHQLSAISSSGTWRWEAPLTVGSATPGIYQVTFLGRDCVTGVEITRGENRYYWFDSAVPTVSLVAPSEGRLYVDGVDGGPSPTGTAIVVGAARLIAHAEDESDLSHGGFRLQNVDDGSVRHIQGRQHEFGSTRSRTFEMAFLGRGTYVVTAFVVDDVGNVSWSGSVTVKINSA